MRIYVGVTDSNWYEQLSKSGSDEVNFWTPSGRSFKALKENELFLFKLHSPNNYIVGGGFFVKYTLLPAFLAWDAFKEKNGTKSYDELKRRIQKYRGIEEIDANTQIGCIVLTEPFWFDRSQWIPVPEWHNNIVSGRGYSTDNEVGRKLFDDVQERIADIQILSQASILPTSSRYSETLTKHRLGQGGFRVAVTEAYQRRCAITGEKTLPVLEAAHIKPFAENGEHAVSNGILLKSDFHTLFDKGYITLTNDYKIEVSHRLHDDFGNGRDYYKYQGQKILILPESISQRPDVIALEWHQNNVFLG